MDERRRLLERLQQPVGHLVVHRVRALEHENAAARLERRPARARHDRLLDVGHAHHMRAGGPHPREVGVCPREDPRPRGGALSRAGRSVEEVGVRRSRIRADRGRKHRARVGMVLGPLDDGRGAHAAGAPARAASTAARTSA